MRVVVVGAVLAAVVAGAVPSAAPGAIRRGSFAGTTSASDPVSFKVDRRKRVWAFSFDAVALDCSDGDTVATPRVVTPRGTTFAVRRNRFGIAARNDRTGFRWDAEGRFRSRGRRATGTLKVFASFDEDNRADPAGTIKCESAPLTWSVRRKR
jgi:hypothetical protein